MRKWKCKNISGQDFSCEGPWTDLDVGLKSNFSLHDASCLGSVMVPLRLHPCNWHIQLSLTYSAFCARKAIEHFGSTSVLTSSYWNCIFSDFWNMRQECEEQSCQLMVFIQYYNFICHIHTFLCCDLMCPHGTRWYACVLLWWPGFLGSTGHQEGICQNRSYSHSLITVCIWRTQNRVVIWTSCFAGWIQNVDPLACIL